MTRDRSLHTSSQQTAVTVRLIAFVVATASLIAIPAALVEGSTGTVPWEPALYVVGSAVALILLAVFAVRSVDPLKN